MYGYDGGWWMFFAPLLSLGLLVLIAWAVIRLVQGSRGSGGSGYGPPSGTSAPPAAAGHGGSGARPETAREVLDRRLASGELDIETYRAIRAELDGASGAEREP